MDHDTSTAPQQVFPYKNLLGSAAFAAPGMRPDIAFAISNVACFAHRPTASHCSALKKIVAYLKGTKEFGISFQPSSNPNFLTAYCNADYAMDLENHKNLVAVLFSCSRANRLPGFLARNLVLLPLQLKPNILLLTFHQGAILGAPTIQQAWLPAI